MKWLFFFAAFLLTVQGVSAVTIDLNVTACSGATSCSVTNYNANNTNIGHTVAKAETGVTDTWTNFPGAAGSTINDVDFHLRHGAAAGVGGSWTIQFYNEAGTTLYCDVQTAHSSSDTYFTWDSDVDCSWTVAKLNDLEVRFISGDDKGSTDAYVYYADLFIDYTEPVYGYLNTVIDDPPDPTNASRYSLTRLNATITCEGATGAECGTVTASARYNASSTTADTNISEVDGDTPLFVNGTRYVGDKSLSAGANLGIGGTCFVPEGMTWAEGYWWIACSSPDGIYQANPDLTLTGTSIPTNSDGNTSRNENSGSGITYNGSHLILVGFDKDSAFAYTTAGTWTSLLFSVGAYETVPHAITWDGSHYYVAGTFAGTVFKVLPNGTRVTSGDFTPGFTIQGLTYVESTDTLWLADSGTNTLKEYYKNGTATGASQVTGFTVLEGVGYNSTHFNTIHNGDDTQELHYYNWSYLTYNPQILGSMVLNDVETVQFDVNMTALNQSFELDVYFQSDNGNTPSNHTADTTLSNITVSTGGGGPPANPCELDCSTNPVTSTTLNCGILNITGTGRWTISAAVSVVQENRPSTCPVDIVRGSGSYSVEK